jgi:branched-chain amino acid transport system substrate-binding protein
MKKSLFAVLAVLMITAMVLAACPAATPASAPEPAAPAADAPAASADPAVCTACDDPAGCVTLAANDPLTIAWMFVVSGPDGSLGTDTQRGAEIAQDDRPTVAGHTVELIGEDEGCNAEGGQAAGTKVASNSKVVAAIGTNCSSAARAAIPLLLTPASPWSRPPTPRLT